MPYTQSPEAAIGSRSHTTNQSWHTVQESLSQFAQLTLGRYCHPGSRPETPISHDSPVCALMRAHPEAGERCREQCDAGVRHGMDNGRTQLFTCHAKLSVFIAPYSVSDDRGGISVETLLGGKAFLDYASLDQFRDYALELGMSESTLADLIPELRIAPLNNIKEFLEHARAIAEAHGSTDKRLKRLERQNERVRHLMEVVATLDTETRSELPLAILHGVGVLFNTQAGLLLGPSERPSMLRVSDAYNGNNAGFSDDELLRVTIDVRIPWVEEALSGPHHGPHESVGDILKAGFPANSEKVELFSLGGEPKQTVLAILNTDLSHDDRGAIAMFCRYAGLLMAQDTLSNHHTEALIEIPDQRSVWDSNDPDELAEVVLEQATAAVGAERGSVMLVEPDGKQMRVRAIRGLHLKYVEYVRIRPGEGVSGQVWSEGQPLLVDDIRTDPVFSLQRRSRYHSNSFVSLPIQLGEHTYGVLNLADKRSGSHFTQADLQRLAPLAQQGALALDRMEAKRTTEVLRRASMTDYLTDLLNRGALDQRLREEVERARRYPYGNPLSILVIDIDDFKRVNDTYGLLTGDDCIRACAQTLKDGTRNIDSVYRRGGEEFTVLLPHTSREAALTLAERLCRAMAAMEVTSKNTPEPVRMTISIGLATFPEDGDTEDALFTRANQALHVAKRSGKDQVVSLPPGLAD